jgi:SnoaL-like protein
LPTLEDFRTFFLRKVDAFSRRDWQTMLDDLPESFEWHFPSEVVDRPVAVRPRDLEDNVADLVSQFPDLKVEPLEIVEPAPDAFVVRLRVDGSGASSGAPIRLELAQLWEFEGDLPLRVREFTSISEALAEARQ